MRTALIAALAAAAPALAQQMYGFTAGGTVVAIDTATGAGSVVGSLGVLVNAAASLPNGHALVAWTADTLHEVDPATATVVTTYSIPAGNWPTGFGPRGLAVDPTTGTIYAAMSKSSTSEIDRLYTIDLGSLSYTLVGDTGRTDIQGLAADSAGNLYAVGIFTGLYLLNTSTGAATIIGGSGFGGDDQALEFDSAGTLYAARVNLRSVDTATGNTTIIGPTGQSDLRGLAFIAPASCYPDCDANGTLDLFDFLCFTNAFNAGLPYADCNKDSFLDLFDFLCFTNAFNAGCP